MLALTRLAQIGRSPILRGLRLAALVLLAGLLASCGRIDPDQARLCRILLPVLQPEGRSITVTSVASGAEPNSIRINYQAASPPLPPREHVVLCQFGGGSLSSERQTLTGVVSDGRRFSDIRLHIIKRWWLNEPEAALQAPPPSPDELAGLPALPRTVAVTLQHVLAALPKIAIYALLAPAYALIYGLLGRVNLSFGELAIIGGQGAVIGGIAGAMSGGGPLATLCLALLLALAAAATHGEFMARAVFGPLASARGQTVLVASLGLAVAGMEYVRLAQGATQRWTPPLLNTPHRIAHSGDFIVTMTDGSATAVLLCGSVVGMLLFALRRSGFGRNWRAVADDAVAARLLGVDPDRVLLHAFAFASLLAGLAGFIMTTHYGGIGFSGGLGLGLKALAAAIAGGIGSVAGAVAGALLIGGFEALWSAVFLMEHADLAVYVVLVLLLLFRPGGLFGFGDGAPRRV